MMRNKKYISFILTFVLFINSIICTPVYAEMTFEDNSVTENVLNSENTEDSLETTTIGVVSDNVESSSSVIVDIIGGIKDIFGNYDNEMTNDMIVLEDTVLSDSAIDFQLDTSEMTDEVIDLVNSKKAYSKLSQYEKYLLMEQVGVREDTMIECEKADYSIIESVPKALIMQRMCFNLSAALKMIQAHKSESAALEETKKYVLKSYECSFMNDEKIFSELTALLRNGYTTEEVLNAFVASKVFNTNVSDIIKKSNKSEATSDNSIIMPISNMADSDNLSLKSLADEYSIDTGVIEKNMSSDDMDLYDLEAELKRTAGILGVSEEKVKAGTVSTASSDDTRSTETKELRFDTTYNTGPINIEDAQMNVSKGTGFLYGSKEICNISGINGLDLKLDINYSSSINKYNHIENRFGLVDNWFLSVPYLMDKNGDPILKYYVDLDYYSNQKPRYITLGNGESYYLDGFQSYSDGSFRYRAQLCYNDELYLYSDNNSTFGNSSDVKMQSKYKLRHKDGKYDYFNNEGQWLATTDKFGNTIKLVKDSVNKYRIVDTKKNSVTIDIDGSRVSAITTPDNKKFRINYATQNIDIYKRGIISSYIDGENNTTTFTYQFLKDDNSNTSYYSNALLTNMKLQSGMEYRYTYGLANVAKYYSGTDTGDNYPRVTSEAMYYDNVVHNQKQITYSTHNYTDANSKPLIKCLCTKNDYSYCCDCYNGAAAIDPCIFYLDDSNGWTCTYCNGCSFYADIDDNFTYTMTEKENNGISTTYTFDVFDRLIEASSNYKNVKYTYDDGNKYAIPHPKTITTVENGNTKVERFTYTRVGDIGSYVVENNGKELHREHHYYDWDGSNIHYNLETKAEYFKNGNEKITVTNELSNSNKTIGLTKITNNKNEILAYTKFTYNPYTEGGQLTVKKEFIDYNPNENEYYNSHKYTRYSYSDKTYGDEPVEASPILVETYIKEYDDYDESFTVEYSYDEMGRKIEEKNDNSITKYEYNALGDITKESYSDEYGHNTVYKTYTYNYTSNTCDIKDENGNSILYDFDPAGKLVKVSQGSNTLATYTYNNRMLPVTFKEGKAVTTYTYDNRDRLTSEIVKENSTVLSNKTYSYEMNGTGLKTTETIVGDAKSDNITNVVQNDVKNRPVSKTTAGNKFDYEYDMMDNVIKESNYIGNLSDRTVYLVNNYTYDHLGNVLSKTMIDDNDTSNATTISATYDMLGRMTSSTDAKGYTTSYLYNALDQVTEKEVPFDDYNDLVYTYYNYKYDGVGNVIEESVTDGVTNKYKYDYRNRVTTATAGWTSVYYNYDNVGNIIQYSAGGSSHKYDYDGLNRLIKYTDALKQSETYIYDTNNDMVKKVDRNGKAITYTYDGLHRMLTEKAEGVNNSWTYGLTGGIIEERNDNATKSYTYNSYGLPSNDTVKIGNDSFNINRYYDTRGNNVLNKYYKNGTQYQQVKYAYDNKNRLYTVNVADGTSNNFVNKVTYYYDKRSNLSSAHYPNNTYTVYYYNAANLVYCSELIDKSDKSKREHIEYKLRLDGNMKGKTEVYNGYTTKTSYGYDDAGRLTWESLTDGDGTTSIFYGYDVAGNRTSMKLSGHSGNYTENYSYDSNNRLIGSVINYGSTSAYTEYTYDKNGNQTKLEKYTKNNDGIFKLGISSALSKSNKETEKFTYNGLNQLTGYESTNGIYNGRVGLKAEYKYMANGYRLSKTVNDLETKYLWDGDNIDSELNSANVITTKLYRGHNLICDNSGNYYMPDAHGNIIEIYNGNDKYPNDWYLYNAFGTNDYFCDTDTPYKWGYCGQLRDWETGNYYMRARYYNPGTGRFISEDPIRDGSNWYSYCGGNPVLYYDSCGLYRLEKDKNGQVYAVIEKGDTLSDISYSEVGDALAYLKLGYAEPGSIVPGQYVNITEIYDSKHPIPTNIAFSKTSHTQGDTGLRDLSDAEVSRRARDKSLTGKERQRYQKEEKLRGQRNKQKRKSHYNASSVYGPQQNQATLVQPNKVYANAPTVNEPSDFWGKVGVGVATVVGITAGVVYFFYTGNPDMVYKFA